MPPYTERMLAHFHEPHNSGVLTDAHVVGRGNLHGGAPYMELYLRFEDQTVAKASFTTFGCGAAIACGSVLTDLVLGQTIAQCRALTSHHILSALDGLPVSKEFCATLAIAALEDAIRQT